MKSLMQVESFGGTDADSDDILLKAFEDHKAYQEVRALRRHMIIGKKGSGKTAIYKKLITTKEPDFFCFGHTFSDYPWDHHAVQARKGIPDFDKYTHSWKYLMLLTGAKLALNYDQSLPFHDINTFEDMQRLESFVVDTYGSRDPDVSQLFTPTRKLRLKPYFELNFHILKTGIKPEEVPIGELPTIVAEVNAAISRSLLACLNPSHSYFVAFDQLDLGFDPNSHEYAERLIGLLLAARDLNNAARQAGKKFFVVIFLRDDIYETLHFEDKNKMTENFMSVIEWDTPQAANTLKALMEKRFSIVLGEGVAPVAWTDVFNEQREMPGHQRKYEYLRERTYLRPRDVIKFVNHALEQFKARVGKGAAGDDHPMKIDNVDMHATRAGYSEYLLREIDDEVHKHWPQYQIALDVLRSLGQWQFSRGEFDAALTRLHEESDISSDEMLERLYDHSLVGFYRAGGGGFGGSEYRFRYRESRTRFDPTSTRFRVHSGLVEALQLKRS